MEEFWRKQEEFEEWRARQHNEIMALLRELAVSRGCNVSDWPSSAGVDGVEGTQSDNGCETKVVMKSSVVSEQDSTQQTDGDQKINTVEDIGTKVDVNVGVGDMEDSGAISTQSGHEERTKESEEETTMVVKPAVEEEIGKDFVNQREVCGSSIIKQDKDQSLLQSSNNMSWGWSLVATTRSFGQMGGEAKLEKGRHVILYEEP